MPCGRGEAADERAEQACYDERPAEKLIRERKLQLVDTVQEGRTPGCECAKSEGVGRQADQNEVVILNAKQLGEPAET